MKIKVALITGGYTGESEVSLKSAAFVESKLDREKYDIYAITITADSWFYVSESGIRHEVDRQFFRLNIDGHMVKFDVAFIVLHGSPGEDGRLQGYLDMVGVPYTSSGVLTSAIAMNKTYTKAVIRDIPNLYVAQSVLLLKEDRANAFDKVTSALRFPVFVKPNAGGSSIGMSKVNQESELPAALDRAYDAENTGHQVIVEEFVSGREFSQGVYRDIDGTLVPLPATEVITTREFFDFEAKYIPGLTQEITPAPLSDEQKQRADKLIQDIYIRLDCKGMVRIDFFLEKDTDRFYFIEINTIPGQTEQSFIPQQVRAHGLTETEFYSTLIESALTRGR